MMPKLDGISVLKQLKQDADRFVPVILVTAKADTRDVVNGLEAGADEYLTKPFEQAALVARVRSLLRMKELHDTVQLQTVQLKEQTEQLSSWNRTARGAGGKTAGGNRTHQPPATIPAAAGGADDRGLRDAPDSLLASHRREVTVVFCDLRGFTAFTETSEPEEVMAVLRRVPRKPGRAHLPLRGHLGALPRRRHHDRFQRSDSVSPITPSVPCGWRWTCGSGWSNWRPHGAARAMSSGSASASRPAMRRSDKSASSNAANIPSSAASQIWRRGFATRRAPARS